MMTEISKKGRTIFYTDHPGDPHSWFVFDQDGFLLAAYDRIEDAVKAAPNAVIDRKRWVRYLERLEALTHDRLI